ncbi:molybdopterin synthase sulfur carrier subunit [Mycolicibacterium madagascariense]|uniref:Molybdopterin synthase sulfur carrier subunit n=1 Tax=Mycolicibacterium madagascariense TaxID=212765 RepID=A0A7I7XMQ8_9MYCO|nr:molybdopterin synthase sulfur carrier subunit [Mycolicibacterium madagascariense]
MRYFAAARAAAGLESETVHVQPDTTIGDLVTTLGARGPRLAVVLARCSFLCDGVAVRDLRTALGTRATVDVLPPFAGG